MTWGTAPGVPGFSIPQIEWKCRSPTTLELLYTAWKIRAVRPLCQISTISPSFFFNDQNPWWFVVSMGMPCELAIAAMSDWHTPVASLTFQQKTDFWIYMWAFPERNGGTPWLITLILDGGFSHGNKPSSVFGLPPWLCFRSYHPMMSTSIDHHRFFASEPGTLGSGWIITSNLDRFV